MAEYISFQPTDFFDVKLYTGNSTTDRAMTGVGFEPSFLWIKGRNEGTDHELQDAVRGSTKYLNSNDNGAEATETEGVKSFDADGYTLGNANYWNWTAKTFVGWSWKAGTTTGIAGSPSITPTSYSFNATSGFSIIKWAGTGSNGTLPHGLGVAPKWILVKRLEGSNWICGHEAFGWTKSMIFNEAEGIATNTRWQDTSPTSTLFYVDGDTTVNNTGSNYIAYVWADKKGYSSFGSYKGNGSADGPFTYTGFRPAFVMTKPYSSPNNSWYMFDRKRQAEYNPQDGRLEADGSGVEQSTPDIDFCSNGFKLRATDGGFNTSGTDYCYMAFAEFPIVSSNDVPGVAR